MPTQTYQNSAFGVDVDPNIDPIGTDKDYETLNHGNEQELRMKQKESVDSKHHQVGCKAPPCWGYILIVIGVLILVAIAVAIFFFTRRGPNSMTDSTLAPPSFPTRVPASMSTTAPTSVSSTGFNDCSEVDTSGIYTIVKSGLNLRGYCQVDDRGKYVVIQQRKDGSVNFYRNWADYRQGFGNLTGEFWLGNDNIHALTAVGYTRLRIDLEDWQHMKYTVYYNGFWVAGEEDKYKLTISDFYGPIPPGDSFSSVHNAMKFSTYDEDNDAHKSFNCASDHRGGWWYGSCHTANLNGEYNNTNYAKGINWNQWHGDYYSLKKTMMMLTRP